ncbi:MAG: glycoside hydrolase family 92 protein [Ruminococcaceae bacterium]|nr:glycoside hydrolase family 92 protein [Oscillospiraceae bacterium]
MKIRQNIAHLAAAHPQKRTFSAQIDPTDYADPLFGVGSATSAGPTLPAGSIHPSPETLEKDCGGYLRNQPIIGFGNAFISGAGGRKCYGNFLLAPMTGKIALDHAARASFAVKGSEIARSYEYRVTLENGISAKVTPAHNAAIYEFVFPAGKEAVLLIDAAHKLDIDACMKEGNVTLDPDGMAVCGGGLCTGNYGPNDWRMYFALKFDTTPTETGYFKGNTVTANDGGAVTVEAEPLGRLGAYLKFGVPEKPLAVKVKIAISFVSINRADQFLAEQIPGFDYDAVRDAAHGIWRQTLGCIELASEDSALLRRFYTAMYHMNVQPRDRTSDHGTWDDFHTLWDTWKTVFPLYSLLYPRKMGEIIDSFLDRADKNAALGNGIVIGDEYSNGEEFVCGQGGNDVDNVIVDAYLKGVELFRHDWEKAYEVLLKSSDEMRTREYIELGFAADSRMTVSGVEYSGRFKSGSGTLGFAFNDRAILNAAKELGTAEDCEKYEKRALNWLNVWNNELVSEGFTGFPQGRHADGSFDAGYDPHGGYNTHYYEATGWDASYINYNDVPNLVRTMGGRETFINRLLWACSHSVNYYNDDLGREGYLNFTNEPSFHIPWLFCTDEIRRPDLAAKVIDDVIKRFSLADDYPGDEDNGGMSSYYVFLMCGFFPYATTENYYLHGTRVEKITFHLGNGRDLLITGENVEPENIYVQSATWQGRELSCCKLTHRQILEGGELHFVMGSEPSDWGRQ